MIFNKKSKDLKIKNGFDTKLLYCVIGNWYYTPGDQVHDLSYA